MSSLRRLSLALVLPLLLIAAAARADDPGEALREGLVDEIRLFVLPVLIGGGTPALPSGVRVDVELLDEHRFESGAVHLRYRVLV